MLKTVQLMTVLPGGVRHGKGNDVWLCPVQLEDGIHNAYVKLIPPHQLVREVACALVGQAAGLPVVSPGVAVLDNARLDVEWRFGFATLPVRTRTVQRIRDDQVLREQLSRWPALPAAVAFDEWIANADRTFDNLLFRGVSDFLLIDHGEAIPNGMSVKTQIVNRLARLAFADVSRDEENVAVQRVQHAAAAFDQVDFEQILVASLAPGWEGESMMSECCRLLADRLPHLDDLIVETIGARQQTLPLRQVAKPNSGTRE